MPLETHQKQRQKLSEEYLYLRPDLVLHFFKDSEQHTDIYAYKETSHHEQEPAKTTDHRKGPPRPHI